MPKRTIKTGIGTYVNKNGASEFGFQGQEVEVHTDDVARFDELNVQPGGDDPHEPPREAVNMYTSPAAGRETSGTASGLNTVVTEEDAAASTAEQDAKKADLKPEGDTASQSRKK